ncbi:MAG: heme NO-binding domain-containing protein [Pontibacterium sp.]
MLGIVFTEFMELVEEKFSPEILDDILDNTDLDSEGVYTSVGYYNHHDMIKMVVALSKRVDVPVDDLIEAFGEHLFTVLISNYPMLAGESDSTLDFLETVDSSIHREVIKLYPQAELPEFKCERISDTQLQMYYRSKRPFSRLALGLMKGCARHYGEELQVESESSTSGDKYLTNFEIQLIK